MLEQVVIPFSFKNINNYRRVRPTHQRPWCVERTLRYSAFYLELELQDSRVRCTRDARTWIVVMGEDYISVRRLRKIVYPTPLISGQFLPNFFVF